LKYVLLLQIQDLSTVIHAHEADSGERPNHFAAIKNRKLIDQTRR